MGLQIRDDRQMKALTGLSQAQFDSLLPIFSDVYQTTQQKSYEDGVKSGTRRRQPGGGVKTLAHLELMPCREFATPEELKAALHGVDRLLVDATERAYHRSTDDAKQREHYSEKKTAYPEEHGHGSP